MIDRDRRYAACTHGELARSHAPWADKCDACHVPHSGEDGSRSGLFDTHDRCAHSGAIRVMPGQLTTQRITPHTWTGRRSCILPTMPSPAIVRVVITTTRELTSRCAWPTPTARVATRIWVHYAASAEYYCFSNESPGVSSETDSRAHRLKFNHALHLATGLTEKQNLDNPSAFFQLGQVQPEYREQYQRLRTAKARMRHCVSIALRVTKRPAAATSP